MPNPADSALARRPHVIWFVADQLRWDALGFTGNPVVRTPVLDRLAASGAAFRRMFVQSPVCMTSRACMLTGRYMRTLRIGNGCSILDPSETTLPEVLQRHGWQTGLFGKLHLTPQQYTLETLKSERPIPDPLPFLAAAGSPMPPPADPAKRSYGFQHVVGHEDILCADYLEWLEREAPEVAARMPYADWRAGRVTASKCARALWRSEFPGVSGLSDVGVTDIPEALHPTMFVGRSAAEFFRARRTDRPSFMYVSFVDPHHPWSPPGETAARYSPDRVVPPRGGPSDVTWPRSLRERAYDFSAVTPLHARTTVARYYAMIDLIDRAVGEVVRAVEEAGELENTIFAFTNDHGEFLGDFGLFRKGSYHYDSLIQTPCFISAPGRLAAGRSVDGLTQSIDVAPTLLGLAGVPVPPSMQGDDLSARLRDGAPIGREWTYTDMYTSLWGPFVTCWTLRTATAKLNYFPQDRAGVLVDLAADPEERRDLWAEPGRRGLRDDMLALLLDAQHQQRDPVPRILTQW